MRVSALIRTVLSSIKSVEEHTYTHMQTHTDTQTGSHDFLAHKLEGRSNTE